MASNTFNINLVVFKNLTIISDEWQQFILFLHQITEQNIHNSKTGRAYTESTCYISTEVLNVSAFLSH